MWAWITSLVGIGWAAAAALTLRSIARVPALPQHDDTDPAPPPRVLVVVPARDEAERLGTTIERLRTQRGVDLVVVLVDDRSTDGTRELVDTAAATDARFDVVHVEELPEGWLGKNHACHAGFVAGTSTAEGGGGDEPPVPWTLFMDADSWLADDAIRRAVDEAARQGADHLSLSPHLAGTTLGGRVAIAGFDIAFYLHAARTNADDPRTYIGIGAFNLLRTEAYRAVGGHEELRGEVVDDLAMGRALRRAGLRSRMRLGRDVVESRWVTDLASLFRLTRKNFFAALDFDLPRAAAIVAGIGGAWILSITAPLVAPSVASSWIAFGGLASFAIPGIAAAARQGWPAWNGLVAPLGPGAMVAGVAWSTWCTLRHGVVWRGRRYPVSELKRWRRRTAGEGRDPTPGSD